MLALRGLDLAVDVTTIAIHHDDVEELLPVHVAILVSHDVRVPDLLKQSNLQISKS
jgi:hypothetical protein